MGDERRMGGLLRGNESVEAGRRRETDSRRLNSDTACRGTARKHPYSLLQLTYTLHPAHVLQSRPAKQDFSSCPSILHPKSRRSLHRASSFA